VNHSFDVIVIGGGHAGAEAARVCARGGARTAMVTMLRGAIGRMSCNPAIGGLAKGNLVKEIDALGGLMGEATDRAGIQFKVLNRSKGPAVQGPRAQCDRDLYAEAVQDILASESNLSIIEGSVKSVEDRRPRLSVVLNDGTELSSRAVVITTGTFLRALMHSGETKTVGGRFGEPAAETLSDSLRNFGLRLGRLKTGTPPRVVKDSVDFSKLEEAPGDETPRPFSILTDRLELPQVLCHLTYTSAPAHELIRANLHRAPMYSGQITATGPRYCPSIEDKVVRFADKQRHQIFVEPEGLDHPWLYLNGISTSLPSDVQDGVVRSMPGFENASIARYGYAVEYDFVNPEQLLPTLQVRDIAGLFLAGQINGTSGYEEAGAQGLLAGMNALQFVRGAEPVILRRDLAYAGVMIDDLVTKGVNDTYRLLTSRAEHRLILRHDNADLRLTEKGRQMGLVDDARWRTFADRRDRVHPALEMLRTTRVTPTASTQERLAALGSDRLARPVCLVGLLRRPELCYTVLADFSNDLPVLDAEDRVSVEVEVQYGGYLHRQNDQVARFRVMENRAVPKGFSYSSHRGISRESADKLEKVQPLTLGQAGSIPGVTPPVLSIHLVHLGRSARVAGSARAA